MPQYDYSCPDCDHVELDELTISSNAVVKCKICGATMTKLPSSFRASFRMTGHRYENGYNEVKI